ncbi:MAG TPA: cytochrome c [Terriglobia bacterium]|nr:cytochrome c [Terriglobia bacterium]
MTYRQKLVYGLIGGAILAVAATSQISFAAEDPTDLREAGMKSMLKSVKALKKLIDVNGDKNQVAAEAQNIVDVSAKIPSWFPKEAGKGEAAKPDIWEHWDQFTGDAKNLNDQAAQLVAAAKGDQDFTHLGAQFQQINKACGTCHDSFREKD